MILKTVASMTKNKMRKWLKEVHESGKFWPAKHQVSLRIPCVSLLYAEEVEQVVSGRQEKSNVT